MTYERAINAMCCAAMAGMVLLALFMAGAAERVL